MAKAESSEKNKYLIILFIVLALMIAILSSLPAFQNKIRSFFLNEKREVLAKITSFYGLDQTEFLILKIKDSYGLVVEIYEVKNKTQQIFRQKFEMTQDSDAYITIEKNPTNFALSDVDKDGQLDILVPSVDRNGNLRLSAFRFNQSLNIFEPLVEVKN